MLVQRSHLTYLDKELALLDVSCALVESREETSGGTLGWGRDLTTQLVTGEMQKKFAKRTIASTFPLPTILLNISKTLSLEVSRPAGFEVGPVK